MPGKTLVQIGVIGSKKIEHWAIFVEHACNEKTNLLAIGRLTPQADLARKKLQAVVDSTPERDARPTRPRFSRLKFEWMAPLELGNHRSLPGERRDRDPQSRALPISAAGSRGPAAMRQKKPGWPAMASRQRGSS